ncbi:hypothetical protein PR048_000478 [Dryococelus australis]|uniref:Uncharacterized protein n=1 Tax=Dryococelus australis TaxID=614101 RepID=A0ABQ9IER1_9NEOP|nr:hypothetical protein PR048_000478 [Dryococelus australis]
MTTCDNLRPITTTCDYPLLPASTCDYLVQLETTCDHSCPFSRRNAVTCRGIDSTSGQNTCGEIASYAAWVAIHTSLLLVDAVSRPVVVRVSEELRCDAMTNTRGATVAKRLDCSPPGNANRRVFSGIFRFPHPFIPTLPHTHLASPSSALETSTIVNALKESAYLQLSFALEAELDKGDTVKHIICAVAATRKAMNWRLIPCAATSDSTAIAEELAERTATLSRDAQTLLDDTVVSRWIGRRASVDCPTPLVRFNTVRLLSDSENNDYPTKPRTLDDIGDLIETVYKSTPTETATCDLSVFYRTSLCLDGDKGWAVNVDVSGSKSRAELG